MEMQYTMSDRLIRNDSLINYFDDDNECTNKDESKAHLFFHPYGYW
jgi:hypothetical protein